MECVGYIRFGCWYVRNHDCLCFCAFSYATVFCEDLEYKYARYSINRGNTWKYVVSKAVVVYGSSVITMVLGSLLFVASIRLKIPWTSEGLQDIFMEGMYGSLIAGEHYWSYVFYVHCKWECWQGPCHWRLHFCLCLFLIKC